MGVRFQINIDLSAQKHIITVLSLKDKLALANSIRKKELILSVVGPQREVDVSLMFLYYTLNFNPKSESTQRLIQPKIDTTVPSLLDFEEYMSYELKPLSGTLLSHSVAKNGSNRVCRA